MSAVPRHEDAPFALHRPPQSDDYAQAPVSIELLPIENARVIVGRAYRCGITQPGTPGRAVYEVETGVRETPSHRVLPGLWVLEGGRLAALEAWYRANPPTEPVLAVVRKRRKGVTR